MNDALALILIGLSLLASLAAFFAVLAVLFHRRITAASAAIQRGPGRALLVGSVNFLFWGALALAVSAIGDSTGVGVANYLAAALLVVLGAGVVLGWAAVGRWIGLRAWPNASALAQAAAGGGLLSLAAVLPFLGWFGLLPYTGLLGLGGVIVSLFSRPSAAPDWKRDVEGAPEPGQNG